MKKFLPLLLAVLLAFGFCGCAGSDAPDEPEATQVVEEPDYVPAFSDAESAAMASFMNKNRALIYESALYTFDFDSEYRPVLARYTPGGESAILADDCVPEFLSALDGRLFYVNTRRGGVIESIAPDGSDRQVLLDENCDWLQIYDGELYFCDGEAQFWHMQPDGSGKTLLLQGPCYYPYVFDGHIVYQDGRDECLYLADTATGETLQLSYVPAYAPVILGGELYATEKTDAGYGIYKLDFQSGTAKSYEGHVLASAAELFIRAGEWQIRYPDVDAKQYVLPLAAINGGAAECEYSGYRRVEYITPEYLVESEYEAGGRIRRFTVCGADGAETEFMAGTAGGQG